MAIPTQQISNYKNLVDELLKDTPNEGVVKKLMATLGIPYSKNSVDRLSAVLSYNPKSSNREKAQHDL